MVTLVQGVLVTIIGEAVLADWKQYQSTHALIAFRQAAKGLLD